MSVLVIQLPPRDRLRARSPGADATAGWRLPQDWTFVFSSDGRSVAQSGQAAVSLLPRADSVVLVLAEADVGWHRVLVPRAPAARLRAALAGVMEEALLDDDEALHFALASSAVAGREGWVAVTHRPWLTAALAAVEGAGRTVERVVPAAAPLSSPAEGARGHFFTVDAGDEVAPWLTLARADGVVCLRLAGSLARALLPAAGEPVRWTATPAAAAAAERWLGVPVPLLSDAERALEAARGADNLRQFELAPRRRGTRVLRIALRRFLSREWRPVRVGLVSLVVLQLVGLNAYAWRQREAIVAKRQAMSELLRATHPGVRTVLDAPVQMERETELLRAAAGRPGDTDLEVLLSAAAGAWPDGQGPVQTLRFEAGLLTLAAPGWAPAQQQQFRERLRSAGFATEFAVGRLTVTREQKRGTA
jgi:general secretion pathway protein L